MILSGQTLKLQQRVREIKTEMKQTKSEYLKGVYFGMLAAGVILTGINVERPNDTKWQHTEIEVF